VRCSLTLVVDALSVSLLSKDESAQAQEGLSGERLCKQIRLLLLSRTLLCRNPVGLPKWPPPLPPHPPTSASVEGVAGLRSRFLHRLFTKVSRAKINFAAKRDGDAGPVQTSRTIYVNMLYAIFRWADRLPRPRYTFLCFLTQALTKIVVGHVERTTTQQLDQGNHYTSELPALKQVTCT
jgi:hypothetical protein